ncbi:MAG: hypothetical protein B6I24_05040 [Bacteroidetes bacterium 4572_128]|nr:MAG: hypothetical protein B6I24_05040 [Bacteroidetes bacterium 4572_128]
MKKKKIYIILFVFTFIFMIFLFFILNKKQNKIINVNSAFSSYISAFTSNIVSKKSNIKIRFTKKIIENFEIGKKLDESLFVFEPNVKGETFWIDNQTLEFRPKKNLKSGKIYNVNFALYKILKTPKNFENFEFSFQTIKQNFSVKIENIENVDKTDLSKNKILGKITTSDIVKNSHLEKILNAKDEKNENLVIKWEHLSDGITHNFEIENVIRKKNESFVHLKYNGKIINANRKYKEKIKIPALNDFSIISAEVIHENKQYILLKFSDPLNSKQNLDGLISLKNSHLKFTILGNKIKVYPNSRQKGVQILKISQGIKNLINSKFKNDINIELLFEELKPDIKLSGKGVILPDSEGLIFPFKAVNLSAVDVKIIQIFENNISQFLQVNKLDGNNQMRRVGRILKKESIKLTSEKPIDYGKWNNFYLDLSKLIEIDESSIYRIELSFRKKHSLYVCENNDEVLEDEEKEELWEEDAEISNWDYYGNNYYGDYNSNISWRKRDDPCDIAYYLDYYSRPRRKVSRNILTSNLGVIAKIGNDNNLHCTVTDLRSTEPISNVKIEIYNFQNQLIKNLETDNQGFAKINLEQNPYLLIVKKDKQRAYLRLDDGSSLSVSKFDVGGQVVQKGIKGYIFGERGVWRPGDSIFINFVLEDKNKVLPANHPISFYLKNPSNQVVQKINIKSNLNGFYDLKTKTDSEAPTGNWTASVEIGGVKFNKTIKIETVKPNRLKIKLKFEKEFLSVKDENIDGNLNVKWMHGAIAKNMKAKIDLVLKSYKTEFKTHKDFSFDDPVRKFNSEKQNLFNSKIDEEGNAKIFSKISVKNSSPGMLKANFITKVFEESGNFSIDRFSIPYSPYESYVGIRTPKGDKTRGMLLTDKKHKVEIVTLDDKGKSVSVKDLEVKVYKINWRWWWDTSRDNLASYAGSLYNKEIIKKNTSTGNDGNGSFSFQIKYPDWGRYLVRVINKNSGHATGKIIYIDWPGWAGRARKNFSDAATMLSFSSNKKKYEVGETAKINIPSSSVGRALVSLENSNEVLKTFWLDMEKGENTCEFEITKKMSPNIYVHTTLLQKHSQTANDLPIRMYGVIPIMVENPKTKLKPEISMPEVLIPEEEVTIKVEEKNGEKMTYTLAVVDEGLLDLTRFKTPDLWKSFYAREFYKIKTWDVFDNVIGAYGGKLEQMFSVGGDGELRGKEVKKANRFKPMVKFLGTFELSENETNTHKFKMPRYIGSVRTMLIAGQDGAYGKAEKTTPVRSPLMVLGTLPRVISVGEKLKLPVTVFAMEDKIKNVKVQIESDDLLILNEKNKEINFSETGDKDLNFDLKVSKKTGFSKIKIIAKSGSEKAEYDIEIEVKNPNPYITKFQNGVIDANETFETNFDLTGVEGTNNAIIEVSNIPPINFGKRLKYLISYPHGCVEQITSAAFPQLYLSKITDLDKNTEKKTIENVKFAIQKLQSFVLNNGGMGYWQNSNSVNDWGTTYAGHFMLEAEKMAYVLPIGFKKKWIKYQTKRAKNWSPQKVNNSHYNFAQDALSQSYRLYTLALAKSPVLSSMNRLREMNNLSPQTKWRLAASYVLVGQNEVAKEIIKNLKLNEKYENKNYFYTYGSSERDLAMILETLALMKERKKALVLVEKISDILNGEKWLSTQTTAYCLMAMSKFVGENPISKDLKFYFQINEKESEFFTKKNVKQISILENSNLKNNILKIKNNGSSVIYAKIILEGKPEIGEEVAAENNLKIKVSYKDMKGRVLDLNNIIQGTDFYSEVTLTNNGFTGYYKNMALTQVFPSGWEILNTRMTGDINQGDLPNYQDIRDDKVYTYFDIPHGKSKTFIILLNASYIGNFYLPPVNCEAMYNASINARTKGKWINLIKI